MGDRYDPSKESSYILDLGFNNLYGYCMEMPLPVGKFQWINENQFDDTLKNIMEVKEDSNIGYIFHVDLEYLHSSLPLAPEQLSIPYSDLSSYCQSFPDKYTSNPKLIPNLRNKTKYITHNRNLQLYVRLGMIVTKVHKILQFDQRDWMRPYIELNTRLRRQSKSVFEQNLFKLTNNSVYGMSIFTICIHFCKLICGIELFFFSRVSR